MTGREHREVALRRTPSPLWKAMSECERCSAASARPDPPLGGESRGSEQPRGEEAGQPPAEKARVSLLGTGPQSPSDSPGLHASAVGAEGAGPRRTRRTRSKVRGPGGGEAPAFCAVAPPGLGAGLRRPGGGVRSGPASTSAWEPRSAWPPGLFGGLQVSRTIEGLRRLSLGTGHLSDLRSICPAACQQPSPQKMGEQREGAVLGPLRKSRVLGTPPCPLTLSVSSRVIGAAQETLGPCWAQLPLHLCLSVFVSGSVWLFPSLSPPLQN